MKRRFVIPAAVAMALHAFLLFGFRTQPGTFPPKTPASPCIFPPIEAVKVEWPDPVDDRDTPAPRGSPAEAPPSLDELFPKDTAADFTMTPTLPVPRLAHTTMVIPGTPGDPQGSDAMPGPAHTGPFTAGQLDAPPRTRAQLAPVYPYEAQVSGRSGEVLVEFVVDEAGHVLAPRVLHSSDPLFEAPTLRAVAKWRFEPGRRDGRVVRFRMAVPVAFAVKP
jgi:protein TonB